MRPNSVSIIITTYNWKEALELALISYCQQSFPPNEIIIADDGSKEDTKEMILNFKKTSPIPIKHIWQEDKGFRLSKIRNKAIVESSSEYLISVDGDSIAHKHFIKDHIEMAEDKTYVCASLVYCSKSFSEKWLKTKKFDSKRFFPVKGSFFNWFRNDFLRKNVMTKISTSTKGGNMGFWRKDAIKINGYDEDYEGWGFEDNDFVAKLHNIGVKPKTLKMGGLLYHLYVKKRKKYTQEEYNKRMQKIKLIKDNNITKTVNGLDKYLKV